MLQKDNLKVIKDLTSHLILFPLTQDLLSLFLSLIFLS